MPSAPDLAGFASPWEHARLLSDRARNDVIAGLLARRAPGARVLEVGCGVGVWSCLAARLGAREVWAVEPTPIAAVARELVARNGLGAVVHVLDARVEDLAPRPVDLAFSELLNADPFAERVVEASVAARAWLAPGALLAPGRLRVYAALARAGAMAAEGRAAAAEVRRVAASVGLDVGPVLDALAGRSGGAAEPYALVSATEEPVGPAALAFDVALGEERASDREVVLPLAASEAGPVGGVVVWFEADYDGVVVGNGPGSATHWGRQVYAWPEERGVRAGASVPVRLVVRGGALVATPAGGAESA